MSRIHTPAMSRMQNFARNPVMIALIAGLALASCAKKPPNSAGDLGLGTGAGGAATPGSAQDFTVNVGDRIFFDTDSSSIRADASQTLDRQAQWLPATRTTRSPLKAMLTNAARANTTSRSAPAVRLPPRITSLRAASRRSA